MAGLTIGGVPIDVHVEGAETSFEPMAPNARRGARGGLLSAITSTRGDKGMEPFRTIPLDASALATQEAAVAIGVPLSCVGELVGGTVTCFAHNVDIESIAGGALFVLSFELHES